MSSKNSNYFINIDYIDGILHPGRRGMSSALRRLLYVSSGTFSYWRRGIIPNQTNLKRFADILSRELSVKLHIDISISADQLRDANVQQLVESAQHGGEYTTSEPLSFVRERAAEYQLKLNKIPVLSEIPEHSNADVSDRKYAEWDFAEYVYSSVKDPAAYAVVAKDDAMHPRISEGDYVVVSPNAELQNNCIAAYRLMSGESGIRRYKKLGIEVNLISDNNSYKLLRYTIHDFALIHRIVEISKKV